MFNRRALLSALFVIVIMLLTFILGAGPTVRAQEIGGEDHHLTATGTSFTYHGIDSSYPYCSAVSAADLDGDGDLDVLSGNEQGTLPNAGSIHWWQHDGSGSFIQKDLDTGSQSWGATSFYANDMDDDGDTDVAAISITYLGKFATFENQGEDSWRRREQSSSVRPLFALSPVGWTVSGTDRLLGAFPYSPRRTVGGLQYLESLTDTGWILPTQAPSKNVIYSIYPDDMDRDGDADIVLASRNSIASIYWYEWDDHYVSDVSVVQANWSYPAWVQTGDIDRDGDPDVIAASDTQGLFWWENKDGNGQQWTKYRISYEFYTAPSLHLVDMDNDSDLDVLGGTRDQMIWLENLGDPKRTDTNWVRHVVDTKTQSNSQGYALFPADLNGDGQLDIVGCDLNRRRGTQSLPRRLGWWENKHEMPSANQISWRVWDIDTALVGAWGVDVADFNGDGRLDVAAAGYGDGSADGATRWYQSTVGAPLTPLTWTPVFSKSFASFKGRGVTAYADGRGQPRFLVSGASNYTAPVWEFYGNGWDWTHPGQSSIFTGSSDAYISAAAELYPDGTADIIGALTSIGHIGWWNSAVMNPERIIATGCDGARGVCAGDFDGDGDLDVAAACQNENRIHWWQNDDGYNAWTAKTIAVNFPGATAVECGDINGDGVDEMIAANSDVAWFKPDATIGDGATMGWITKAFTGTEFLELHDLDRDGDLDVLATSPTRDELAWLENTGTGSYTDDFPVHGLDESVGGIREVAAGDLNGDGAPDIVVAAQDAGLVRWYEQIVDTQLSLEKALDPMQTEVISTGESIAYEIRITNNSLNGATADVLVVDRWEPPDAIVDASSDEDCIADVSHGVMTCTLSISAGQIKPMHVVLTPSLLFDGFITNTAQVLPVAPYWNSTSSLDTGTALPVDVEQDKTIWDGQVSVGHMPSSPILPGQGFTYDVSVVNVGPKSGANATVTNLWSPISAIDGFSFVGAATSTACLTAADYNCIVGDVEDGVMCDFSNLAVGVPLTVTIGVTTSEQFTDLLEADIYLTAPEGDEGIAANNQPVPVRVGSRPWEKVYLPLIVRN